MFRSSRDGTMFSWRPKHEDIPEELIGVELLPQTDCRLSGRALANLLTSPPRSIDQLHADKRRS